MSIKMFSYMYVCIYWRRKWQPTPVFLPGESQGWASFVGCCPWGHTESDTTEATQQQQQQHVYIYINIFCLFFKFFLFEHILFQQSEIKKCFKQHLSLPLSAKLSTNFPGSPSFLPSYPSSPPAFPSPPSYHTLCASTKLDHLLFSKQLTPPRCHTFSLLLPLLRIPHASSSPGTLLPTFRMPHLYEASPSLQW